MSSSLSLADAGRYARIALANIERDFPAKLDHVIGNAADLASPHALHPAFFGCFDWHSCVHAHWLLARAIKLHPQLPETAAIRSLFDVRLVPLASAFVQRYLAYLPDASYPIRHGMHSNSAFGLAFALDFARSSDVRSLTDLCLAKARQWYLPDRDAAARWEPSGADFLSPSLIEADLMRRVLDTDAFALWLDGFLPDIERHQPATLFTPAIVSDRTDPYIVHLDGLNLSRAWCWRAIESALPAGDPRACVAAAAASEHLSAGLEGIGSGEYVGDHWLATFAVLALTT